MLLDAIIIADAGTESVSTTSAIRFNLNGKAATIQNIKGYINNKPYTDNEDLFSWSSSLKLNGIFLFSYLKKHGFNVELVNNYFIDRTRFSDSMTRNPSRLLKNDFWVST